MFTPSRILALFCLSFAGGVFLSSFGAFPPVFVFAAPGGAALLLLFQMRKPIALLFALSFLGLFLGFARTIPFLDFERPFELPEGNIEGEIEKISFRNASFYRFLMRGEGGPVQVSGSFEGILAPGDIVSVSGVGTGLGEIDEEYLRGFLAKDGVRGVVEASRIEKIGEKEGWARMRSLLRFSFRRFLPAPEHMVAGAIVLGDKEGMSRDLKEGLSRAGVRHVTAISGMHAAIVLTSVFSILLFLGLRRGLATAVSLGALFFFIALTGFQASALRAGIMGALAALSVQGSRELGVKRICIAGALMLAFNPLLLKHDLGFQLSFLAVLGIIILLPALRPLLSRIPEVGGLRDGVAMSLSAQIFTLPLLASAFGGVSLASVPATSLILPALPGILGFGSAAALAGVFAPGFAPALFAPLEALLWYAVNVVRLFASFPFVPTASVLGAAVVSLAVCGFVLLQSKAKG